MKKLLLAAAVVAAAGGAGYLYQNEVANSSGSDALLSQVPADALLITYQTKPINFHLTSVNFNFKTSWL